MFLGIVFVSPIKPEILDSAETNSPEANSTESNSTVPNSTELPELNQTRTDADRCYLRLYEAPNLQGRRYTIGRRKSTPRRRLNPDVTVQSLKVIGNRTTCCYKLFSLTEGWKKTEARRQIVYGGERFNTPVEQVKSFRRMLQCSQPTVTPAE